MYLGEMKRNGDAAVIVNMNNPMEANTVARARVGSRVRSPSVIITATADIAEKNNRPCDDQVTVAH